MRFARSRSSAAEMLRAVPAPTLSMLLLVLLWLVAPGSAAAATGSPAPGGTWTWPLPGHPPVLRGFEPPPSPYAPGHRGVDLGAPIGTPVRAAGAGVVGFAARLAGRGVVTVVHGPLRTTYEPVTAVVHAGQPVVMGQQIGWLAAPTGQCGPGVSCLHWGLLRGSVYLDPLSLLGPIPVRLLPRVDGGSLGTYAAAGAAAPGGTSGPVGSTGGETTGVPRSGSPAVAAGPAGADPPRPSGLPVGAAAAAAIGTAAAAAIGTALLAGSGLPRPRDGLRRRQHGG